MTNDTINKDFNLETLSEKVINTANSVHWETRAQIDYQKKSISFQFKHPIFLTGDEHSRYIEIMATLDDGDVKTLCKVIKKKLGSYTKSAIDVLSSIGLDALPALLDLEDKRYVLSQWGERLKDGDAAICKLYQALSEISDTFSIATTR